MKILIILGSIILRLIIIYTKYHGINSDNAILGLMAKHILQGELPVFFYGQPYMGSLEAYIIAFFFLIFGISTNTMCLTMIFITTLGIVSAYFLGKEIKDRTLGLYAMLIASLPPIYTFWHGLAASGGYPETLLFGNILLILTLKITKTYKARYYILMGLISGVAFWTHMVIAYYLLPIAVFLLINEKSRQKSGKKILFFRAPLLVIPTFIIGSLPLWFYNIKNDFDTFKLPVSKNLFGGLADFLNTYPSLIAHEHPALPYYILLSIYIISFLFLITKQKGHRALFLMLFLSIIYFFSASHLSSTRCAKYLIPMTTIIIISNSYLAWYLNKKTRFLGYIPLLFILSFNSVDIYKTYLRDKKADHEDHKLFTDLIAFLDRNGLRTNYCVFWISQKLNFLSNERIINANYEGERYLPYEDIVESSDNIAFIERDNHLEPMFNMLCKSYRNVQIGPFYIYYNLKPLEYYGNMLNPKRWKANSNYNNKNIGYAFDRNADTYWGTIINKTKGMYFELDLGSVNKIYKIALFNNGHWKNFPGEISLEISKDGKEWEKVFVPRNPEPLFISGPRLYWHLEDGRIEFMFYPKECRFLKITQDIEDSQNPWEINEIFMWEYLGEKAFDTSKAMNLKKNGIDKLYCDFWLSAKIGGKLKPINKQYPHRENTSRLIDVDEKTAFIIDNEIIKPPPTSEYLYWSGYGPLKTNRLKELPAQNKKEIIFKGGIKFLGYNITTNNKTLNIDYFWQIKKIPRDIFVFVHFVKDGKVIFQNDHPLLEKFPLIEVHEEIFRESYTIENPPSGNYDIILGLWKPNKDNKRIGKAVIGNITVQ